MMIEKLNWHVHHRGEIVISIVILRASQCGAGADKYEARGENADNK
jgi:hypothetical protein